MEWSGRAEAHISDQSLLALSFMPAYSCKEASVFSVGSIGPTCSLFLVTLSCADEVVLVFSDSVAVDILSQVFHRVLVRGEDVERVSKSS